MVERNVNIRMSFKDGEIVKRGLLSLGEEGQRALKRIESAGAPASRSLLLVSAAAREARQGISSWAAQAGAGGRVLAAFGPGGLAAAAGFAAMTLGAKALFDATKQAVDKLDQLQDSADRIGVGTEGLQALRFAATQLGVDIGTVDGALQKLSLVLGDVARGENKAAAKAFETLGFSVTDAGGRLKTVEEALPGLADGFAAVADQQTRLSLSQDIFGRGFAGVVTILQSGSDALDRAIQKARDMGAVIDAELVKKGADAKDELDALAQVIDAQLTGALVDLAPVIVAFVETLAAAAKWAGELVDSFRELDNRSLDGLRTSAEALRQQIEELKNEWQILPEFLSDRGPLIAETEKRLADIEAEIAAREADALAKKLEAKAESRVAGSSFETDESEKAAQLAAKLEAQAYANVVKDAAAVFAATRTEAEKYAAEIEHLNGLLAIGEIDQDTYNRAVEQAGEPLRKAAEEQRKAAQAAREAAIEARKEAYDARTDAMAGIERALARSRAEALDDAAIMEESFVSIWESAEDALTDFVKTGKLSLDDLEMKARDIAAKLAVHYAKQAFFLATGLGVAPNFAAGLGAAPAAQPTTISNAATAVSGLLAKTGGGGSVQSQIWSFFAGKGLPAHQIAGIMGNIAGESGFNPSVYGDSGNAYGLFQHNGPRRQGLFDFAGSGAPSVQQQLEFAWKEMQGNSRYGSVLGAGDVASATRAFGRDFEAPADLEASIGKRIAAAKQALTEHGDTIVAATGDLAGNLKATAEATGQIGAGFSNEFASGLSKALGGLGGSGGGGSFFSFLTGMAGLSGLGPMTRPHGYYAKGMGFRRGFTVDAPTVFPMARGAGLMGEDGPEGVLPLRRNRNGDLGVILANAGAGSGGGPRVSITINNSMAGDAQVETRQRDNGDGTLDLMVAIDRRIDRRVGEIMPDMMGVNYETPKRLKLR
jgi:hypothetical protein